MKKVFFMFSILVLIVLVSYPADSAEAEIDLSSEQRKKIERQFLNLHSENTSGIIKAYNQLVGMGVQMMFSLEEVQEMVSGLTIADIYEINYYDNNFCYQMMETCSNPTGYDKDCFLKTSGEILNNDIYRINSMANSMALHPTEHENVIKKIFIAFLLANKRLLDGLMD